MQSNHTVPSIYRASEGVWVLAPLNGSYVIQLHGDQTPVLAHWGEAVDSDTAISLARAVQGRDHPWESVLDGREEYPSETGPRFVTPAVQLRFADASRAVRWVFDRDEIGGETGSPELQLHFRELAHPVRLVLHYRLRGAVIERWATVSNCGTEAVEVIRADAAAWNFPPRRDYRASTLVGRWAGETQLQRSRLDPGERILSSRRTTTSPQQNPWVAIDDGSATETAGEVWATALAWSGTWHMNLQRLASGRVTIASGAGHDVPIVRLAPGVSYESPVALGVYSAAGFGGASRGWHDYTRRSVIPHGDELRPVLYNSWEATLFDVAEAEQIALARRAAALGCELFVMDDGWFGARTSDRAGLGDWTPNPDRFPNGLAPLIAAVKELGMEFGIWVEPEAVNPDSDLYRSHPDWVYGTDGYPRDEMRNQLVLNLARDDVREWMFGWLDALLSDHAISFIKWDMNRPVTDAGWPGEPVPERAFHDHTRNLYSVLDRLRAAHPEVRFESCASGGGRVDLGILARADQLWTSDNTDANDRIAIQHGFSQLYPAQVMTAWVTDTPNFLTGRSPSLEFRFHVAMSGVLGIGGDLGQWTEPELAEAAELVAQYKRIRPVVQHGALHRLETPVDVSAPSLAYESADGSEIVAFQFTSGHGRGELAPPLRLPFADRSSSYRDLDRGSVHSGGELRVRGIDFQLTRDNQSVIAHLRRQ